MPYPDPNPNPNPNPNPIEYIFNGDFVDRGPHGVEVLCVLLGFLVSAPEAVWLNRVYSLLVHPLLPVEVRRWGLVEEGRGGCWKRCVRRGGYKATQLSCGGNVQVLFTGICPAGKSRRFECQQSLRFSRAYITNVLCMCVLHLIVTNQRHPCLL
jgi:hypothetical protein